MSGAVSVLLRPEQVEVAGEGEGVPAEITGSVFTGAQISVSVVVGGIRLSLQLPGTVSLGATIRIRVTGKVVAFAGS